MSDKLVIPQSVLSQLDFTEIDQIGRIIGEEKSIYLAITVDLQEVILKKNINIELCVGDWVVLQRNQFDEFLIKRILRPDKVLSRSKDLEVQKIVSNIDQMWIITSANADFNLNRLERYCQLALSAQALPIIVMTKIDLISTEEVTALTESIKSRLPDVEVFCISVLSKAGLDQLSKQLKPAETIALMGSSGVGKSTLINFLKNKEVQKTQNIGSMDKGRHTTTHRRVFILENGSYIVDNPGIRTVGVSGYDIQSSCKFSNCTHTSEPGCQILEKLKLGELDEDQYLNMLKMKKESDYFESKSDPLLREKRKKQWKAVTKGINQRKRF